MKTIEQKNLLRISPLLLAIFIDGLGLGIFFPLLNTLIMSPSVSILSVHTNMATRNFLYGLVISIFMLMWFFGSAIFGGLSDNYGRRKILCLCLAGDFVGYLFSGLAVPYHSIFLLLVGRIVSGFTAGSQPIAQAGIIDISTGENKARYLGYSLLAAALGFLAGPLVGGILSDPKICRYFNLATPLYFSALIALLNIILLLLLVKEAASTKLKVKINLIYAINLFIAAFKLKSVRNLSIIMLFMILGWSNYFSFISVFLFRRYHYSTIQVSLFWTLLALGYTLGFAYVVSLVSHFRHRNVALVGFAITGIGLLLTVLIHQDILTWFIAFVLGISNGVGYTVLLAMFSDKVNKAQQGWIMGITGSITGMAYAIMTLVSGFAENISAGMPLVIGSVFYLLVVLWLFIFQ